MGTREELQKIEQTSRKFMMMLKALHPRNDIERLNVPRKEGRR